MPDPTYPPFVFELSIQEGKLRVEQPEPLDAELRVLIANAINLFGATSGLRAVTPRATGTTASNPRAEQVRRAVQGINPSNGSAE